MPSIINFLAHLGQDAELTHLSDEQYANQIEQLETTDELRQALINKDYELIKKLLKARPDVICFVAPAEDEPDSEEKPEDENDKGKETEQAKRAIV